MDDERPKRRKKKRIVKALGKLARAQALLVQAALFALSEPEPTSTDKQHHATTAEVAPARRSVIPEWRTYPGFRSDMQHREREYLRSNDPPVSKKALALHVGKGDTEKSINRRMQDYGLDPERDWPPSKWSEQEPNGQM